MAPNPNQRKLTSLPPKDDNQFNNILKQWEQHNYKKALKQIDKLLNRHPKSGECLCVKGLILHSMGRRKEGEAEARKGLPLALMSSISWRVFGLMAQKDRKYTDTAASFIRASKFDPENLTLLRDLAFVQAHNRDYTGLLQTRRTLVEKRPQNLLWVAGYAVALHLNGFSAQVPVLIDAYLKAMVDDPKNPSASHHQRGELVMFKVRCLEEANEYEQVLEALETSKHLVVDPLGFHESKGRALLKLNKLDEAEKTYATLLELNSNNYEYLGGFQAARGLPQIVEPTPSDFKTGELSNQETVNALVDLYDELTTKYPESITIQRLALNFAQGDQFRDRLEKYVRPYLKKTIPSLFSALKKLYIFEDKVKIIEELFHSYEKSLKETNRFPGEEGNEKPEAPSTYMWVLQYLAYHYDSLRDTKSALSYLNRAIEHTPTMLELYLCKGKIYKHAGNPQKAFEAVDEARQFDLADRFLNTLASRYALRADKVETAREIATIFAIQNLDGKFNLDEMQCIWYEIERGESFMRQEEYAKALREFFYINKHFTDMYDDQFDFHGYSLRKLTLNAYLDMIKYFDQSWSHHWYVRAALGAIEAYIQIADRDLNKLPLTAEIKKENERLEKENQKKPPHEIPPNGEMLMRVEKPLDAAVPFLKKLEQYSPKNPATYEMGIKLNLRRGKLLQVLRSIKQLLRIDPENPSIYRGVLQLYHKRDFSTEDELSKKILFSELSDLGIGEKNLDASLKKLVDDYAKRNQYSLRSILATIEMRAMLAGEEPKDFSSILDEEAIKRSSVEEARSVYTQLKKLNASNAQEFAALCKKKFEWSSYFE